MRLEIKEKNCKNHKHTESKQYIAKQLMDHWRNQRGNINLKKKKKNTREIQQLKHNDPKPMEHNQRSFK